MALEVLEVISRSKEATKRPVIFLFNGAEEKGMLVWTKLFMYFLITLSLHYILCLF